MRGTELISMPLTLRPCRQYGDLKCDRLNSVQSALLGYYSNSSNDRYFSCEESLPAYQLDYVETSHQNEKRRMLEDLIKEGSELQRSQKKLDFQSVATIQLASQVLQNSSIQDLPTKNTLDAVTLRSGTQLKGPPLPAQDAEPLLQNTQTP
ncbi:hypothetical protein PIB30_052964 [Stylosanthes scabra]|uniref:Uncharacterized protein n=1 Tax=Stylosanthes scabra TaxID=79078 RepID=A0ABU6SI68_9FABA|nr:hypothetical protein [Stylosanthes scabra]